MAAEPLPVIIDTDCGRDDFMAIAFLLARRDVQIEAITVANGLAHVRAGAENVLRLAEMGGRSGLPVYIGRDTPMQGDAAFPEPWRKNSDEILHGLDVPQARHAPEVQPAADYLSARLRVRRRPVRILALGPLTNLAEALERNPSVLRGVEVVMMGGAVHVPGNLGEGGAFQTNNKTAEWNLFVDPVAAKRVFASGARIQLIPLDATNEVPIDAAFLRDLGATAQMPLGRFVHDLVARECDFQDGATCYAWDALAAAALVDPSVVRMRPLAIEIKQSPTEAGRTAAVRGQKPNADVALAADAERFRKIYLGAFTRADSTSAGL